MDVIRRLRPVLGFSAGLLFVATASAAGIPCAGEACDVTGGCCSVEGGCTSLDGCADECGGNCGCLSGQPCSCGPGCRCGSGGGCLDRLGGRWFGRDDERPDTRLIGAEQKCRHGQMWPPYPRPHENAKYWTQFHAAHYWPHPYNCWDRSWVTNVLSIQTGNGWMNATTLCCYHFDAETHVLNDAGRLQLQWILQQAPPQFRTVYIEADDQYVSATRKASVESEAAAMAIGAPIVVRHVQIAGRPAREVDAIRRAELETQPAPRLRVTDLGTGAGDDNAAEAEDGATQ